MPEDDGQLQRVGKILAIMAGAIGLVFLLFVGFVYLTCGGACQ
jgi:hypothetical protein